MPKLTKIYTKKGDDGTTSLGGGQRVSKDDLRVEAYGTIDELNSVLGTVLSFGPTQRLVAELLKIQNELFHMGSDLCFLEEDKQKYALPQVREDHVRYLETLIDEFSEATGPLQNFILPGGSLAASQLHVARTVCRRAERLVISLSKVDAIGAHVIPYLNRLSDLLFAMARYENQQKGIPETLWNSRL